MARSLQKSQVTEEPQFSSPKDIEKALYKLHYDGTLKGDTDAVKQLFNSTIKYYEAKKEEISGKGLLTLSPSEQQKAFESIACAYWALDWLKVRMPDAKEKIEAAMGEIETVYGKENSFTVFSMHYQNFLDVLTHSVVKTGDNKYRMLLTEEAAGSLTEALDNALLGLPNRKYVFGFKGKDASIFANQVLPAFSGAVQFDTKIMENAFMMVGTGNTAVSFTSKGVADKPTGYGSYLDSKLEISPSSSTYQASDLPYKMKLTPYFKVEKEATTDIVAFLNNNPVELLKNANSATGGVSVQHNVTLALYNDINNLINKPIYTGLLAPDTRLLVHVLASQLGWVDPTPQTVFDETDAASFLKTSYGQGYAKQLAGLINSGKFTILGSASTEYVDNIDDYEKQLNNANTRAKNMSGLIAELLSNAGFSVNASSIKLTPSIVLLKQISEKDLAKIKANPSKYALLSEYINSGSYKPEECQKNLNNFLSYIETYSSLDPENSNLAQNEKDKITEARMLMKVLTAKATIDGISGVAVAKDANGFSIANMQLFNRVLMLETTDRMKKGYKIYRTQGGLFEEALAQNNSRSITFNVNVSQKIGIEIKPFTYTPGTEAVVPISITRTVGANEIAYGGTPVVEVYSVDGKDENGKDIFTKVNDVKIEPAATAGDFTVKFTPVPEEVNKKDLEKDLKKDPPITHSTVYKIVAYAEDGGINSGMVVKKLEVQPDIIPLKEYPDLTSHTAPLYNRKANPTGAVMTHKFNYAVDFLTFYGLKSSPAFADLLNGAFATSNPSSYIQTNMQKFVDAANTDGTKAKWDKDSGCGTIENFLTRLANGDYSVLDKIDKNSELYNLRRLFYALNSDDAKNKANQVNNLIQSANIGVNVDWKAFGKNKFMIKTGLYGMWDQQDLTIQIPDLISKITAKTTTFGAGTQLMAIYLPKSVFGTVRIEARQSSTQMSAKNVPGFGEIKIQSPNVTSGTIGLGIGKVFKTASDFLVRTQLEGVAVMNLSEKTNYLPQEKDLVYGFILNTRIDWNRKDGNAILNPYGTITYSYLGESEAIGSLGTRITPFTKAFPSKDWLKKLEIDAEVQVNAIGSNKYTTQFNIGVTIPINLRMQSYGKYGIGF